MTQTASSDPVAGLPQAVSLRGRTIAVADDKPTFWARAAAGTWEPETLEALEQAVQPGDVVLDIGCWVGPTALFSAALGARVVAVEADPVAQEECARNIAANPALAGRVTLLRAAATPDGAPVRLGAARKRGDSMSSALMAGVADTWECPGIAPAALLSRARPTAGQALVVKIDIEGGEYALAPSLAPLLPPETRAVLLALHPRILLAAGRTPAEVRSATEAVLGAFAGWTIRILDTSPEETRPVADVAATANVTLVLARGTHPRAGGACGIGNGP
jgi:FkbM family methyltransferase